MANCTGHGPGVGAPNMFSGLNLNTIASYFPNVYEEEKARRSKSSKKSTKKSKK